MKKRKTRHTMPIRPYADICADMHGAPEHMPMVLDIAIQITFAPLLARLLYPEAFGEQ